MAQKQKAKAHRSRTYARNRATTISIPRQMVESDSTYFLKLIVVVLLGTLWIKLQQPLSWQGIPFGGFPLGAALGLVGIHLFEKNQFDRKIWYAVLIVITIICYFVPAGIVL
jgi:hypothetical protein